MLVLVQGRAQSQHVRARIDRNRFRTATGSSVIIMDFHPVDYSAAIIRPPSPTSSIGSTHPVDQTSLSDQEDVCSHPEFDLKWRQKIRLGEKREEEDDAEREVLLTRPKTPNSERSTPVTLVG